jgi:DNA-binding GntR family transcriptional regulator
MDPQVSSGLKLERSEGQQPLYMTLATILSKDIRGGKYKPSTILPSEKELTALYGVSRITVRQSLRVLREQGLITSHPGVGTIVRAQPAGSVFDAVNSTEELLAFVGNTEMHAVSRKDILVNEQLALQLECAPNILLSEACFVRKNPGSALPMSYVKIYVNPKLAKAQITPPVSKSPIYKNIERLFNIRVTEIRQDVTATILDDELAEILETKVGEAALQITRFFFDVNQSVIQVSLSFYPASRYKQSARFRANNLTNIG